MIAWYKRLLSFSRDNAQSGSGGGSKASNANYLRGASRAIPVHTPDTALTVSAVYRAVQLLSDTAGLLPLRYMRKAVGGNFVTYNSDPLNYLLGVRPNGLQTPFVLIKNIVVHLLLRGNAYVYPRIGQLGDVEELLLLDPMHVLFDKFNATYTVNDPVAGVFGVYTPNDILHFKHLSTDGGYTGNSVITYAATAMSVAATGESETLSRFSTGGKFKAIYTNKDDGIGGLAQYDDEQLKSSGDEIQDKINSGADIITITGDGQLTPLSMTSTDLQFLENRKFSVRDIARFFGVPASKLMDDSNANYKTNDAAATAFYADALAPILTMIEQEFRAKLVDRKTYDKLTFQFDVTRLYATDLATQGKWFADQLASGLATINELRVSQNKPPVNGGDDVYISCNVAPPTSPKIKGTQPPTKF